MSEEELTPWQKYKNSLGDSRPWDLVNPNAKNVSDDIAKDRLTLCNSCPELIKLTKQCKKCGCFMVLKTKLEDATCPIGKW
jgi:hypothetical protein